MVYPTAEEAPQSCTAWRRARRFGVGCGLNAAHRLHLPRLLRRVIPDCLTVLIYHRVDDPAAAGFIGLRNVVSATPQMFREHLDFLQASAHLVSLDDVLAWREGGSLPKAAILITFDDGYRDNYTHALPAIEERGIPAVFFVTTGFIGHGAWPWWDWIAEAFKTSFLSFAHLPLLGPRAWSEDWQRERTIGDVIAELKSLDAERAGQALAEYARVLGCNPGEAAPAGLLMSWDDLVNAQKRGIAIGAHSVSHPILTRVSPHKAEREIVESKLTLENCLQARVKAFAYPNGDFDPVHEDLVAAAGYDLAFACGGGLVSRRAVRERPFAIRRICVTLKDDVPRLGMKLLGVRSVPFEAARSAGP
jgi:peptidoglycan/xylan/chitin deacetylase (PgdA/CDA1 family)